MTVRAPTHPSPIQVIDRASQLLDALAQYDDATSLKILSADTGLHPSTAFRILSALGVAGLVERTSAGQYELGSKLVTLAGRVPRSVDVRREALSAMEELCEQIGETINLTVRQGDEVIYIERVSPRRMIRVEQVVGSRAPLHVTAVGKLMLGEFGEPFVRAYADRTGLPAFTEHTVTSGARLWDVVARAQADGYALDDEEAEEGVGCIGTLLFDRVGDVAAGLSISAPIERRRQAWVPVLCAAARQVSARLGYGGIRTSGPDVATRDGATPHVGRRECSP